MMIYYNVPFEKNEREKKMIMLNVESGGSFLG